MRCHDRDLHCFDAALQVYRSQPAGSAASATTATPLSVKEIIYNLAAVLLKLQPDVSSVAPEAVPPVRAISPDYPPSPAYARKCRRTSRARQQTFARECIRLIKAYAELPSRRSE